MLGLDSQALGSRDLRAVLEGGDEDSLRVSGLWEKGSGQESKGVRGLTATELASGSWFRSEGGTLGRSRVDSGGQVG